jgi:uncharacterized protein
VQISPAVDDHSDAGRFDRGVQQLSPPLTPPAPPIESAEPTRSTRFNNLDVLRGVAILGTLGTNIWSYSSSGPTPSLEEVEVRLESFEDLDAESVASTAWSSLDDVLTTVSAMLTNGKFLALLSILFGVGMAIQFDATKRRGHRWPFRYWWRNALLTLDGLLHYLLVIDFDILMSYGMTALLVAPLMRIKRTSRLALTAGAVGATHLGVEIWRARTGNFGLPWVPYPDEGAAYESLDVETIQRLLSSESWIDQVQRRFDFFWAGRQEVFLIAPLLSAFLFLLGALLWRSGVFRGGEQYRELRRRLMAIGFGIGVPTTVIPTLPFLKGEWVDYLAVMARYTSAPFVAVGYLGLGLTIMERRNGDSLAGQAAAKVGRMALSCYMLQNILASVIFYRWGIGLGPYGPVGTIISWAAISAMLVLFAHLWLKAFKQGPFETVWRKLADAPFDRADRRAAARLGPA